MMLEKLGYWPKELHTGAFIIGEEYALSPYFHEMTEHLLPHEKASILQMLRTQAHASTQMHTNFGILPCKNPDSMPMVNGLIPSREELLSPAGMITHTTGRLYYLSDSSGSEINLRPPSEYYPSDLPVSIGAKCTGSNRIVQNGNTPLSVHFEDGIMLEGLGSISPEDFWVPIALNNYRMETGFQCVDTDGERLDWKLIPGRLPIISFPIEGLVTPHTILELKNFNPLIPLGSGENQLHVTFYLNPLPITFSDLGHAINLQGSIDSKRQHVIGSGAKILTVLSKLDQFKHVETNSRYNSELTALWNPILSHWLRRSYLDCQLICNLMQPKYRHLQNTTPIGMTDFEKWIWSLVRDEGRYRVSLAHHFNAEALDIIYFLKTFGKICDKSEKRSIFLSLKDKYPTGLAFGSVERWQKNLASALALD